MESRFLKDSPDWMRYMVYGFFGYAIVNFLFFMTKAPSGGGGANPPAVVWRGFSGHWMAFYSAALAILYSAARTADRALRCANGHLASPNAIYCTQCGQPVMRVVRIGERMAVTPRLTPDRIAQVSGLVAQYISTQRDRYGSRATPLSAQQKAAMDGFFSPGLLDGTRLVVLRGERVGNPDFYPMLRNLGFNNLPDQSTMEAITFSDVVVSHEASSDGLLFHELVHVEQYRQLGIPRSSELYVRGFLNGGSYEAIPLEVNAYTLEGRFEANHHQRFSVEDEVRRWAAEGRF